MTLLKLVDKVHSAENLSGAFSTVYVAGTAKSEGDNTMIYDEGLLTACGTKISPNAHNVVASPQNS